VKDEHFKILKTMHEATGRMDINMFSQAVNLTPNQAIAEVQLLASEGFLHRVGSGYGLTDKGKNALKLANQVPEDKTFQFYVDVDKPLGFAARSLAEFYGVAREVCSDALDFHLYRGDFENWLRTVLDDNELAEKISALKTAELSGEELRKALLAAIDTRYGAGELV
jgi:predicted transcriptional regulator